MFFVFCFLPLVVSERSSALTSCWTALCRAAPSCPGPLQELPRGFPAPRLIPLSERVRVDPAELLSMYDESSGSMMLTPEEAHRRLVLSDVVPLMDSRASTRLLTRFTSSPVRKNVSDKQMTLSSMRVCSCQHGNVRNQQGEDIFSSEDILLTFLHNFIIRSQAESLTLEARYGLRLG